MAILRAPMARSPAPARAALTACPAPPGAAPARPAAPALAAWWWLPAALTLALPLSPAVAQPVPQPPLPPPPAASGDRTDTPAPLASPPDPALRDLVEAGSTACRAALARRFATIPDRVDAWLVPGLAIAIEAGERNLAALRREGLAFGWIVRGRPDPLPIGLCRTDGQAAVLAIEEQKE